MGNENQKLVYMNFAVSEDISGLSNNQRNKILKLLYNSNESMKRAAEQKKHFEKTYFLGVKSGVESVIKVLNDEQLK